jgi:probable HAF family extracellular repeat protein
MKKAGLIATLLLIPLVVIIASNRVSTAAVTHRGITGTVIDLGTLGGATSVAADVNEAGQIIGMSDLPDSSYHAYLWEDGIMTDLGAEPGIASYAFGVNDYGQVVGRVYTNTPPITDFPVIWVDGVATPLATLPGNTGDARAINNVGQIVGESSMVYPNDNHTAVIWENGVPRSLGSLGGGSSKAYGINENDFAYVFPCDQKVKTPSICRKTSLMVWNSSGHKSV